MHTALAFTGFVVVSALALALAKAIDDAERRRARNEARGRSSFPPRLSLPGDSRSPDALPAVPEDGRSSGH